MLQKNFHPKCTPLWQNSSPTTCTRTPSVSLLPQFIQYIQNGLTELDEALLTYISPVYKSCPFKVRSYLNGKRLVVKNTEHPLYDKWDSPIN
jgi:hypothetical protein